MKRRMIARAALSYVLTFLLTMGACITAFAFPELEYEDRYERTLDGVFEAQIVNYWQFDEFVYGSALSLSDCNPQGNSVLSIPSNIGGLPVVEIQAGAFSHCADVTEICVPESVTKIAIDSMYYFTRLERFTVSSDNPAFYSDADGVLYNKDQTQLVRFPQSSALTSYTVPDGVTTIRDRAFQNCFDIEHIILPDGIQEILYGTFENCISLVSLRLPNDLTTISDSSFAGCGSLTYLHIPDSVLSIDRYAFTGGYFGGNYLGRFQGYLCSESANNYAAAFAQANNWEFRVCEGHSYEEGDWTYEYTSGGVMITAYSGSSANVTIPSQLGGAAVTAIGEYVFSGCTTVQQITMPDTVTSIGEFSFEFCENLQSIRLSENLTAIPAGAFNADSALESIVIPASVTDIGVAAFGGCTALESVTFSASSQLERIGATAFANCTSLTGITLPDSLRELGYPDRVVENMVFVNCTALESVYIPSGVTDIPCCTHYSYPDDPDHLEMIETGHAFADWPSTDIPWVFDGCDNLQVIYSDSETGIAADFARELVQFGAAAEFRLSAPWVQIEYILNVDPNTGRWTDGSTDSKSYTGTAGTAIMLSDTPVRDGYSFNGWEVTDGDGTLDGCAYIFGESDGTVCAIWTQNHYSLTFDPNGGRWRNGLTNAQTYAQTGNSTFTMTNPPTRDGYLFDGWEVVSGDGMLVDGNQIQLLGSLTGVVRAKWTLHMITLTLELNGGWWQDNSTEAKTYTLNEGATFRLSESPVRSGHAFLGWKVTAGSGATSGNTITPSGNIFLAGTPFVCTNTDVTLTAQWSQKLITLTLDPNGGWWQDNSTEAKTYTLNEDTTFRLSESPVRSGHTFLGWKVTAGSGATSGDTPAPSDNILPPGTPFVCGNTDVTLTAQWEENTPQDKISVTIGDQIGVNLLLDLDARDAETVTVVYKDLNGDEQRETFTDFSALPRTDEGLYKIAVQIAPAQIADAVTVYIDGEQLDACVKDYCNALTAGGYEPEVAALAQAVLDYGQAANNFFNYTDETISAVAALSTDDVQAWTYRFSDTTGKLQSLSFMALTKPEFRFYTHDITEAEAAAFNAAGVSAAYADTSVTDTLNARFVKNTHGDILLEVTGVQAEYMDETIVVTIDGLGTITFAGNDFAKLMASNSALEPLAAALYAYGAAAKACFA